MSRPPCVVPRPCEIRRVATLDRRSRAEAYAARVVGDRTGCEICGAPIDRTMVVRGPTGGPRTTYALCAAHLREMLIPISAGGES